MRHFLQTMSICGALFSATAYAAPDPVAVSVTTGKPGHVISPTSIGVSYEVDLLHPKNGELAYFRPDNEPLVSMFKTLGIKSLRLGGSTLDHTGNPAPNEDQIASTFEFARAAGAKVIYSVRLDDLVHKDGKKVSDPEKTKVVIEDAARAARFIRENYSDVIDCFGIGNEPYAFINPSFDRYISKWRAIHDAMVAEYPEATFFGPDHNPNPQLDQRVISEFGNIPGPLVMLGKHNYPFGCAFKNIKKAPNEAKTYNDGPESRAKMMSYSAYEKYNNLYKHLGSALAGTDITYRLTECNSFYASGLKGASDSYASALWGVDYLYWWAERKAEGLNFHTGDWTSGDSTCKYAVFVTSENGYEARPLAYGLKLFDLGGKGNVLPVDHSSTNLAVYATLNDDVASVTLINKEYGAGAEERVVQIQLDAKVEASTAQIIFLRGRNGNIAGGSADVTLGGVQIQEDGTWDGQWASLSKFGVVRGDRLEIKMPPASAAVVRVVIR